MRYRYEVDESNTLRIWDLEQPSHNGDPIILQPDFPDVTPWTREQAEEWAADWIEMMTNPEFEFYPKEGLSSARIPRRSSQ